MTEASEMYRANAASFNQRVVAVPETAWGNQSPCDDWDARAVVQHVVDTCGMFLGFVDEKLPPAPSVDDNPVAAWHSARNAIQTALDDPKIAQKAYEGMWGSATFEQGVQKFLTPDALIHTWDLARAAGIDDTLDPNAAEQALATLAPLDDKMRGPGAFADKIDPPQASDPQTRLLNFCGREV